MEGSQSFSSPETASAPFPQHQNHDLWADFLDMHSVFILNSQPIRFRLVRFDRKSINCRLLELDQPKGHNSRDENGVTSVIAKTQEELFLDNIQSSSFIYHDKKEAYTSDIKQ